MAAGRVFTPGLRLDDVENRWRRLEVLERRERRCSFRCSTVWACEASAAVYRLTLLTSLPPSPIHSDGFGAAGRSRPSVNPRPARGRARTTRASADWEMGG